MGGPTDRALGTTEPTRQPGAGTILGWACWLGLGSGALEMAIFLLKCRVLDPRNLNLGRHYPWMFPMSGLMVVGGVGLVLAVVSKILPRRVYSRFVLFVLFWVAYATVLFRLPVYTLVCLLLAAGLARVTTSRLAPRFGRIRFGPVVPVGLLAVVAAVDFGQAAYREHRLGGGAVITPAGPRPRNVILVVLDTVRADRLGLYGASRATSPNLDRFAGRGVRFDRAFATAPWTAPSHAGMFTGRWPHELSIGWDRPLDGSSPTLAEVLSRRGYETAGFVANATYCSGETGLDRGFAHYEDYELTLRGILFCSSLVERAWNFARKHPRLAESLGLDRSGGDRKDAARIHRDFLGWLDARRDRDRPFFAFLNDFDAHHPYLAPDSAADPGFGRKPSSARDYRLLKTWWERDKRAIAAEDVGFAVDSYDRCLASLDDQLGRLFGELDRRGLVDDSVVIVTADHGEHLGEHQLFGHGCSLYRQELQVPLIVVAPDLAPGGLAVDRPVSLRDVPSTVLDLIGGTTGCPFPGRSLARTWGPNPGVDAPADLILSEVESPPDDDPNKGGSPAARGPMVSAVDRDHHYIRGGDGREELYDIRRDPGESADLAGLPSMGATLARFRAIVRR